MDKGRDDTIDNSTTFILLSYARPWNMQRIVDTVLSARSCGSVILSNNNPKIDILKYVDLPPKQVTILQQAEHWPAVNRFCIARESGAENFVCIDDDLFLTALQIDALVARLAENPAVPHGVWGANVCTDTNADGRESLRLQGGVHNVTVPVRILNRAYAFTGKHNRRFFELLTALGITDPRELGPADDILLSHSGAGLPICHDLGPLSTCPTSTMRGIALWREPGFFEARIERLEQLRDLNEGC